VDHEIGRWLDRLRGGAEFVGVGIDRLDYTKGIPDRLEALDLFFENNPTYRGRLTFIQVGVPSREEIPSYRRLVEEIEDQIQWLNSKWGTSGWQPVLFVKRHVAQAELMALHRLADFCLVTSLHDGMNLVAKEYVASRFDEDGVLILSNFTGASLELSDALLVNPFSPDEMAQAIFAALTMPREDRRRRMMRLRDAVAENNVYRWAGKIVSTLLKFEFTESGETAEVAYQSV
jgi:trehalose 6-phosphate synthase